MIRIEKLRKDFWVYPGRVGMLRHAFGFAKEGRDFEKITSLKDIDLEVPSGTVHGIIGMNGAGKSTLLKILTGVLSPSSGRFSLNGRVAALLELGTGFHGELSGRENVFLNGAIMGMSRSEVAAKLPAIEAFAELGEFFDRPVKIYSSGMYVRLAFSFAVMVEPDVLIIDEALSVGDAYFQQKCLKKIRSFKDSGTTILFVSHDLGSVKMLCEQVTLLSKGEVIFSGAPMQALDLYNALLAEHQNDQLIKAHSQALDAIESGQSYESGSKQMEITKVTMQTASQKDSLAFVSGDQASIRVRARVNDGTIVEPTCGILIRDRLGYDVFGVNSDNLAAKTGTYQKKDEVEFRFTFDLNLGPGEYTLTLALHADKTHVDDSYHWIERALIFKVLPSTDFEFIGVSRLNPNFESNKIGS